MSVFYSSEYNKLFLFVATCLVGEPSRMEILMLAKGFPLDLLHGSLAEVSVSESVP